jgi:hypothetical protein
MQADAENHRNAPQGIKVSSPESGVMIVGKRRRLGHASMKADVTARRCVL